jgi:dTDP-4-dehydrorhamnose reductase
VHFGSGCIFCGDAPTIDGWREDANANPKSYYSKTKYAADLALSPLPNTTILRLRMPISHKNNPRNLLNKIISYQKVLDHPNSMTFLDDLVRATDFIIKKEKTGIYNVVSSMPLTHPMLLEEYKKYVPTHTYEKITEKELDGMVKATRSNCILSNKKIVSEGFEFAPTLACMHGTIKKFAKNK